MGPTRTALPSGARRLPLPGGLPPASLDPVNTLALPLDDLLATFGPWALFAMTLAETCFVTGLMVPAGVATALGGFLAAQGFFPLGAVVLASGLGAWTGDMSGFLLGRRYGPRLLVGEGYLARTARRWEPRTARFFHGHPFYAVTLARLVSFVRTFMPWMAGMSTLSLPRFLAFDLPGVVGYVALYSAAGFLAGETWQQVVGALGMGGGLLFALVALGLWMAARWGVGRGRAGSWAPRGSGPPPSEPGSDPGIVP